MKKCSVEGCEKKHCARGYCHMHYQRYMKTGNVHQTMYSGDISYFIDKYVMPVPECGCWIWMGSVDTAGYGNIKMHQKRYLAHRKVWEYFNGEIPDGLHILHKCDTPACVNPDHLFLGTHDDNMKDAARKGRFKCKVPIKEVPHVADLIKYGYSQSEVAEMYGVKQTAISQIMRRRLSYFTREER